MTPAQEILKLIETVDPTDSAKLDEIDILVYEYLEPVNSGYPYRIALSLGVPSGLPKYTRSRDALKAIRPEGWSSYGAVHKEMSSFVYYKGVGYERIETDCYDLPTEELAELHAIIQATEFERTQKGEA